MQSPQTLYELNLVPAAIIYCSFTNKDHEQGQLGFYLSLAMYDEMIKGESKQGHCIPSGAPLHPTTKASGESLIKEIAGKKQHEAKGENSGEEKSKKLGKPKWLKL